MGKPVMTLTECTAELRRYGIRCSPMEVGDCIEKGIYPFGRLKCATDKRRTFEIWRMDFEAWLKEKGVKIDEKQ